MSATKMAVLLVALCLCASGARAQAGVAGWAGPGAMTQAAMAQAMSMLGGVGGGSGAHPLLSGMQSTTGALATQYQVASSQLEAVLAAYEAQYCSPAKFTPSTKKPATFVGHSFGITFSTGSCIFDEEAFLVDGTKELSCVEPSISYVKNPANFTSKYHKAPKFVTKECKMTKTFGESSDKVLFVFDGKQAPDMNALTAKITQEVQQMLGAMAGGKQNLLGGLSGSASGPAGWSWGGAPAAAPTAGR